MSLVPRNHFRSYGVLLLFLTNCQVGVLTNLNPIDCNESLCHLPKQCIQGKCILPKTNDKIAAPTSSPDAGAAENAPPNPEPTNPCPKYNACGTCQDDPSCMEIAIGSLTNDVSSSTSTLPTNGIESGLVVDPKVGLRLTTDTEDAAKIDLAWIANTEDGTVSAIDLVTAQERSRFASVRQPEGGFQVPEWNKKCNLPSRTAVDARGDAYVANRNHTDLLGWTCDSPWQKRGSITKIAYSHPTFCDGRSKFKDFSQCHCLDRNNNGWIETSQDKDKDGKIRLEINCIGDCKKVCQNDGDCPQENPYCADKKCSTKPQEFFGADDECLLYTTTMQPEINDFAETGSLLRGLALDANGMLWVGEYRAGTLMQLDPSNGKIQSIGKDSNDKQFHMKLPFPTYGLMADANNFLYSIDTTGRVLRIDTASLQQQELPQAPKQAYGLIVTPQGDIWTPVHRATNGAIVQHLEAGKQEWKTYQVLSEEKWREKRSNMNLPTLLGKGITQDQHGMIWAVFHEETSEAATWLVGLDERGEQTIAVDIDSIEGGRLCRGAIGVGPSNDGKVWIVSNHQHTVCGYQPANGTLEIIPVGKAPYSYSDFTGHLAKATLYAKGTYQWQAPGCLSFEQPFWHVFRLVAEIPQDAALQIEMTASPLQTNSSNLPKVKKETIKQVDAQGMWQLLLPKDWLNHEVSVLVHFLPNKQNQSPVLKGLGITKECRFAQGQ